jgi:predicted phosphodiesterase
MRILHLLFITLLIAGFSGYSQSRQKISFNTSGELKIVQFTDTHIELKDTENLEAYIVIENVMKLEKPDLVVLTGDIVTEDDPQEAFKKLAAIFEKYKTPWAVVFGNHESEHNLSRKDLAVFLEKLPFCINANDRKSQGYSNFIVPVSGNNGKPAAQLYFMDSNEYSTLEPTVGGWGWFTHGQVGWYRQQSSKLTASNNGDPFPALAFFHIPLPEYTAAWNNKAIPPIGVKNEDECSPVINTGMFAAMLECGDVMGTFVGHDHINDYIGIQYGIALAYGRVSKVMKDADDPMAGGRVILLKEGKREFNTWIREGHGKKVLECKYPGSFVQVKKEIK